MSDKITKNLRMKNSWKLLFLKLNLTHSLYPLISLHSKTLAIFSFPTAAIIFFLLQSISYTSLRIFLSNFIVRAPFWGILKTVTAPSSEAIANCLWFMGLKAIEVTDFRDTEMKFSNLPPELIALFSSSIHGITFGIFTTKIFAFTQEFRSLHKNVCEIILWRYLSVSGMWKFFRIK